MPAAACQSYNGSLPPVQVLNLREPIRYPMKPEEQIVVVALGLQVPLYLSLWIQVPLII